MAERVTLKWRAALALWWTRAWAHPALVRALAGLVPGTKRPPASPGIFVPDQVRRVLVGRMDGIGDMILTLPLLAEIRRLLPNARVTVITSPKCASLLRGTEWVDEVLVLRHSVKGIHGKLSRWAAWLRACREIGRQSPPDLAIFPRWDVDPSFITALGYLTGSRWRLGYTERTTPAKSTLNRGVDTLLTHSYTASCRHEASVNTGILNGLGLAERESAISLTLSDAEKGRADAWLRERGLADTTALIALGVAANEPKRQWPIDSYVEALAPLVAASRLRVIVFGGPSEARQAEELCAKLPGACFDATGCGDLRDTAALLARCTLYVGNNSGPMHLAALMKVPVVYISSHSATGLPTDHDSDFRFGPSHVPYTCLQPATPLEGCAGGCTSRVAHCICQVSPKLVTETIERALSGSFDHGQ